LKIGYLESEEIIIWSVESENRVPTGPHGYLTFSLIKKLNLVKPGSKLCVF